MLRKLMGLTLFGLLIWGFLGIQNADAKQDGNISGALEQVSREEILSQKKIPVFTYRIQKTYPHNITSYTEGLLMDNGYLFEGTGRYGKSDLFKSNLETGQVFKQRALDPLYFGEGVTIFKDLIFQLTYKSNTGFIYDKESFSLKGTFRYLTQGWGLTTDGNELIMSNGSAALVFLDPETFNQKRYIVVSDNKGQVGFLNELEFVNGEVYANVWQTNLIARINPKTGKVTGWIDLTGINPDPEKLKYPDVLNGIAYNPKTKRLIVTGKCWPNLFEIELVPIENKRVQ